MKIHATSVVDAKTKTLRYYVRVTDNSGTDILGDYEHTDSMSAAAAGVLTEMRARVNQVEAQMREMGILRGSVPSDGTW